MIYDLQKASGWKRASAFLFDAIMLCVVAVLMGYLISMAVGYDSHNAALEARYAHYAQEYGVNFNMSVEEYEALDEAALANVEAAYAALNADEEALGAFNMVIQLTMLITSLGLLLAFLVMEFTIPMVLGNGQTLGKKIFGIAVMKKDGVRINGVTLFVRTVLGKYTIETMLPALILMLIWLGAMGVEGTLAVAALLIVQIVMMIATRTNAMIHDALASTVAVDLASQMIFNTREDMIAYKQKVHEEKVSRSAY